MHRLFEISRYYFGGSASISPILIYLSSIHFQLFKGKFYYCDVEDHSEIFSKEDCINAGHKWTNKKYNFDNLLQVICYKKKQPLLLVLTKTNIQGKFCIIRTIYLNSKNLDVRNCKAVYYYYATYPFQSESTLYSCLNVKELLARDRSDI